MTTPAGKPTKTMSMEDFYVKTENANKLMRVWYCLAATEKDIGDQAIFWERKYTPFLAKPKWDCCVGSSLVFVGCY